MISRSFGDSRVLLCADLTAAAAPILAGVSTGLAAEYAQVLRLWRNGQLDALLAAPAHEAVAPRLPLGPSSPVPLF